MLLRTLPGLAILALLSVPALADGEAPADLVGSRWQLTTLGGQPVAADTTSTLIISADSIGGNGGCNTYGGDLTTTDAGIDITNVFSTMMACDGLEQEQAFFAALEAADNFAVVDGNLQLLQDGAVLAELAPTG